MDILNEIIKYLPNSIVNPLNLLDKNILCSLQEIRIKRNMPAILVISNSTYFLKNNGEITALPNENVIVTECKQFEEIFLKMCDYSVYSKSEGLMDGYITLSCGARVGVCSSAIYENGVLISNRDITSLSIRIPRQCLGCSIKAIDDMKDMKSVIVAGPPNSGKTTFLRDMAYQISSGYNGFFKKVTLIDSRNEFAGKIGNEFSLSVGYNTDVLTGYSKAKGIEIAIRSLSPNVIVCDEIANELEIEQIAFGFSCGVDFFLSVHGNKTDSKMINSLMLLGNFSHILLFDNNSFIPKITRL